MSYPTTLRYPVRFSPSATGLVAQLVFQNSQGAAAFQRLDTFAQVAPPALFELGGGNYYFDWTWQSRQDPDIVFTLDAGPSVVTDVERYVSGTISPRDVGVASSGSGGGSGGVTIG